MSSMLITLLPQHYGNTDNDDGILQHSVTVLRIQTSQCDTQIPSRVLINQSDPSSIFCDHLVSELADDMIPRVAGT
jgi:hypothetical protein